eukprot:13229749-Ditylum_brightwellii.AAC.1
MVTFSKLIIGDNPQCSYPQELRPIIPFKRDKPQELVKGECYTYTLRTIPYNVNMPTYGLVAPYFDVGTIKGWLKFWQNLEAVITRQNITDAQAIHINIIQKYSGNKWTSN